MNRWLVIEAEIVTQPDDVDAFAQTMPSPALRQPYSSLRWAALPRLSTRG
jgi:hypothetical protein